LWVDSRPFAWVGQPPSLPQLPNYLQLLNNRLNLGKNRKKAFDDLNGGSSH
jgi:hypothetical protein